MAPPKKRKITTPLDILHRASRPQHDSSYIPPTRDWRYRTGVFEHSDALIEEYGNEKSIWDVLDEDILTGVYGRERRRTKRRFTEEENEGQSLRGETVETMDGQEEQSRRGMTKIGSREASPPMSRASSITTFVRKTKETSSRGAKEEWMVTGVVARLKVPSLALNLTTTSIPNQFPTPISIDSSTPPRSPVLRTVSMRAADTQTLFEREWQDGMRNFDVSRLWNLLRPRDRQLEVLPDRYTWFPEAVPVDSIFPPGIPLSAKEICAYYPHHIRWQGVAARLLNNDFRGSEVVKMQSWFRAKDLALTGRVVGNYMRDEVRRGQPRGTPILDLKGLPSANLYTDDLASNPLVIKRGCSVPTFAALVRGLEYLPTGIDARELTRCLIWYLGIRNSFVPQLELNVLHTQSLVRALQLPLASRGTRNLDFIGLEEWRTNGGFEKRKVTDVEAQPESKEILFKSKPQRPKLVVEAPTHNVELQTDVALRTILALPLLIMQTMAGEALRLGIKNAEDRQSDRQRGFGGTDEPVKRKKTGR